MAAGAVLQAVKSRLTAQDQDQEVKECAISCAAALIAQLGDCLHQEYSNLMQVVPRPPPVLPACTCAPVLPSPALRQLNKSLHMYICLKWGYEVRHFETAIPSELCTRAGPPGQAAE